MSYSVFQADLPREGREIVSFWKRNFPRWPQSKFEWLYQDNVSGAASCWLVRDTNDGSIVGSTAVFPRTFRVGGRLYRGGITGGFVVDPRHRTVGPAIMLQKATISACDGGQFDFLYGTPNKSSEPVQRRVGYRMVGSEIRLVRVLRSQGYVKRYVKSALVSHLLGHACDLALQAIARERRRKPPKSLYKLETFSTFDERFDRLWQRSAGQHDIVGERTSAFLNWRFAECPYAHYKTAALVCTRTGEVDGYIIYEVEGNVVHVADLFARDTSEVLDRLLAAFLAEQRQSGREAVNVVYFGNEAVLRSLAQFGFKTRETVRNIVFYGGSGGDLAAPWKNQTGWHFTAADND